LLEAINRNYHEELHCQFASQLLFMTLGFVTRMIKNEVLREELSKPEGMRLHPHAGELIVLTEL
jgi:hypothetical protein